MPGLQKAKFIVSYLFYVKKLSYLNEKKNLKRLRQRNCSDCKQKMIAVFLQHYGRNKSCLQRANQNQF